MSLILSAFISTFSWNWCTSCNLYTQVKLCFILKELQNIPELLNVSIECEKKLIFILWKLFLDGIVAYTLVNEKKEIDWAVVGISYFWAKKSTYSVTFLFLSTYCVWVLWVPRKNKVIACVDYHYKDGWMLKLLQSCLRNI